MALATLDEIRRYGVAKLNPIWYAVAVEMLKTAYMDDVHIIAYFDGRDIIFERIGA